jgi:hypothetical protein
MTFRWVVCARRVRAGRTVRGVLSAVSAAAQIWSRYSHHSLSSGGTLARFLLPGLHVLPGHAAYVRVSALMTIGFLFYGVPDKAHRFAAPEAEHED